MATTSEKVATASHQQSASNMAATEEEMTVSVNYVADRAQKTSRLANDSGRLASEGARGSLGMVEEIAEAIREQGTATNNIALQVEKIAQMSEESSAAVEHGADATKKLDNLASGMSQILATYKL